MAGGMIKEEKLVRSRDALKLLAKVEQVAILCKETITQSGSFSSAQEELRKILDANLDRDEYLVLVDLEGRALLHTNRLREGVLFNDPVGIKAARTREPLTQVYYRNTGEVLIDAAAPVIVGEHHLASLRVGRVVLFSKFSPKIYLATLLPVVVPAGVAAVLGYAARDLWWWPVLGMLLGILGSVWLKRIVFQALDGVFTSSKLMATGDLTASVKPSSRDELGQVAFEMNKLTLGLKNIMSELDQAVRTVLKAVEGQVKATEEVSKASEEIATVMQEVASGAQEQSDGMNDAREVTQQICRNAELMAQNSVEAVNLARKTLEVAGEGVQAVNQSIEQMGSIRRSVEKSSLVINDLEEKSRQIGNIVNAITEIADQTNLLALNAAIEAARAGEQGRGFAVVAEEVRKLAEQSSRSAREIMSIISQTQGKTAEAVRAMSTGAEQVRVGTEVITNMGGVIQKIISAVEQTASQIKVNSELAGSLNEGAAVLSRVTNRAMEISGQAASGVQSVSSSLQEQTAMIEEIAASAAQLSKTAQELQKLVKRFKVNK